MADKIENSQEDGFFSSLASELFTSPINIALLGVCMYLGYKIFFPKRHDSGPPREPALPPLPKRDFTLEQLREFDGKRTDGRILIGANGKVFDVTRGKNFYGPGGPYAVFAGRDASRALATFSVGTDAFTDEHDDLSDLNSMQMDSVREWEMQFTEKYTYVGRLLKPGEQAHEYSDTEAEDEGSTKDTPERKSQ